MQAAEVILRDSPQLVARTSRHSVWSMVSRKHPKAKIGLLDFVAARSKVRPARTHKTSPSALCPLHIAILCGSNPVVELLLDGKANPNVPRLTYFSFGFADFQVCRPTCPESLMLPRKPMRCCASTTKHENRLTLHPGMTCSNMQQMCHIMFAKEVSDMTQQT